MRVRVFFAGLMVATVLFCGGVFLASWAEAGQEKRPTVEHQMLGVLVEQQKTLDRIERTLQRMALSLERTERHLGRR